MKKYFSSVFVLTSALVASLVFSLCGVSSATAQSEIVTLEVAAEVVSEIYIAPGGHTVSVSEYLGLSGAIRIKNKTAQALLFRSSNSGLEKLVDPGVSLGWECDIDDLAFVLKVSVVGEDLEKSADVLPVMCARTYLFRSDAYLIPKIYSGGQK